MLAFRAKRLLAVCGLLALTNGFVYASDQIQTLVGRLFEILELRHREVLQTEENITHNKAETEKDALTRILQSKVTDFLEKDNRLSSVLSQMQSATVDPEQAHLVQKSTERLNRLRADIHQIQELYFAKPLQGSKAIETKAGDGTFTEFVNAWEANHPISEQRRKVHAVIPGRDREHLEHLKAKAMNVTGREQGDFESMLSDMEGAQASARVMGKTLAAAVIKPVDAYHTTLTKEATRGPVANGNDQSFSAFYESLDQSMQGQQKMAVSPVRAPKPGSEVEKVLKDLKDYQAEVRPRREVSVVKKPQAFDDFLARVAPEVKVPEVVLPKDPEIAKSPFIQMPAFSGAKTANMVRPASVTATPARSLTGEARSGQTFSAMLAEIPDLPILQADPNTAEPTNRFEVILSDLIAANEKPKHPVVLASELNMEEELKLVFVDDAPRASAQRSAPVTDYTLSPHFVPDFDLFPGKTVSSANSVRPHVPNSPAEIAKLAPTETANAEPAPAAPTTNNGLASRTQARLLRNQASLIPIRIEARDIKDRLYADLPVDFEVVVHPDHSLIGEILDAKRDSPMKHRVLTNSEGIAQIHLLLDLKGKEVNIRREMLVETDRTICKIHIEPRFDKELSGEGRI